MSARTRWAIVAGVSGLIVAYCVWLVWTDAPAYQFLVRLYVDKHFLKRTLREWGVLAPVVFILLQALQVIISPIPGEATGILGGYLFGQGLGLLYSTIGLTVGSIFFFPAETGLISVNPVLAGVTTMLYSLFLWISVRKVLEVAQVRPAHELKALIGQKGEAKTSITDGGTVQVAGELWSARSDRPLGAGSAVKVVGRDGFVLLVEQDSN